MSRPRCEIAVSECSTSTSSWRHTEAIGRDHRPAGLVALTVRTGPGDHLHLAGREEPHRGVLPAAGAEVELAEEPARREPAHLDVGRDADAQVVRVAALAARRLLAPEVVVPDHLERAGERGFVVPAVVQQPGARLVRELVRWDEVAPTDLGRDRSPSRGRARRRPARSRTSPRAVRRRGTRRWASCS